MTVMTRRSLLKRGAFSAATLASVSAIQRSLLGGFFDKAGFTMDLRCSSIGVRADQRKAIRLAHKHGFQSVTPHAGFLADLSDESRTQLLDEMKDKKITWGAAGLPLHFHGDEKTFADGIKNLPRFAAGMQRAGVTRVGTAIGPAHPKLTYLANFRQKATRLRACAKVLADHGQRLGLEYIGPKTLWASSRHSFVHTMAEAKELISEIGLDNVGFVLDSWHWYTAHETADDLRTLKNQDVVACDLNDAPAGIPVDQQIDNRRELPAATGVINVKDFLKVLVDIGYDGPVRAEPFNRILDQMDDDAAVAETAKAMRKAFKLVA